MLRCCCCCRSQSKEQTTTTSAQEPENQRMTDAKDKVLVQFTCYPKKPELELIDQSIEDITLSPQTQPVKNCFRTVFPPITASPDSQRRTLSSNRLVHPCQMPGYGQLTMHSIPRKQIPDLTSDLPRGTQESSDTDESVGILQQKPSQSTNTSCIELEIESDDSFSALRLTDACKVEGAKERVAVLHER